MGEESILLILVLLGLLVWFTNCTVSKNSSNNHLGGGVYSFGKISKVLFTNCTISANSAKDAGGGVYSESTATSYTYSNNDYSSIILENTIFWGNKKTTTTQIHADVLSKAAGGTANIIAKNSILQLSSAGDYTAVNENELEVNTNNKFGKDPNFVSANDFSLQSGSLAINSGDNSLSVGITNDLAGKERISGGAVDIGAYEKQQGAVTFLPADDATSVALNSTLSITFDKNMYAGTGNVVIYNANGVVETIAVGDATISGATVTITPTTILAKETAYYVQIDATAFNDGAGNNYSGITTDNAWNFKTGKDIVVNSGTSPGTFPVTSPGITKLSIQKAITPNGDGINDFFVINDLSSSSKIMLQVFNRWGRRIYYSTDYQNNWEGEAEGSNTKLPAGSYMFIISSNDSTVAPTQGVVYVDY